MNYNMEIIWKHLRRNQVYFLTFILLLIFFILFFKYNNRPENNILKVAYLNIGQGDAIYVEAPNGNQMLIDGGPGPIVLSRLAEVMPFGDRSIDILVVTNPDKDHMAGFVDILAKYKVGLVLEPGTQKNTLIYRKFKETINNFKIKDLIARRGMRILLDQNHNIYFNILFPDRDVSSWSPNDGSIVGKLVYNKESFMMMGDATKYTELLLKQDAGREGALNALRSQVLKLGHHGSHTSSSELWLEAVAPDLAIISAGLHNKYGHPHQDVLDRLSALHITYISTYKEGTIILKTDGVSIK